MTRDPFGAFLGSIADPPRSGGFLSPTAMKRPPLTACLCIAVFTLMASPGAGAAGEDWPAFRGQGHSRVENGPAPPTSWSDSGGIAWKAPLAGFGQSSPIIWKGKAYVTSTGGDHKERLFVEAFDLTTGARIWVKEFPATQTAAEVSDMISRGAPTPAVDESGVHAFFESGDLYSLAHETGELRWERHLTTEFGPFQGGHGIGSSPAVSGGSLVLLIDHEGPSYLLSIDTATGKNRWKTDRESRVSWSSPLILPGESDPAAGRVLISSNGVVEGYDLADGKRLWWVDGIEGNTVASPSSDGQIVVIGSSAPQNSLAIRLGGSGDVSGSHVAWRAASVTCSFSSPLIHRDTVYFVSRAGVLQATDLADGSLRWEMRLPDSCWASPIASGDLLWCFAKNGKTLVLRPGETGAEVVAENALPLPEGDRVYGVAVSGGLLVVRTSREILAIGPPTKTP